MLFLSLLAWSLLPLALVCARVVLRGGEVTGADSVFPPDQYQYLSWIRDAGDHVLIANRFDVAPGHHVFLHPLFLASGLLWKLGVPLVLSYALWKPVVAGALVAGALAYVRRLHVSSWAAVLALVGFVPLVPALWALGQDQGHFVGYTTGLANELTPLHLLWGYVPEALAIGLMPLFLLGAERIAVPELRRPGLGAAAHVAGVSGIGLAVAWLHPWQGLVLVLIVGGAAVWGKLARPYLPLALPIAATLAPIGYYFLLSRSDPAWRNAAGNLGFDHFRLVEVAAVIAPFALLALLGVRRPRDDLQERMLLLWPLATALTYAITTGGRYHAFGGLAVPLAVLGTRAWTRFGLRRAATAVALGVMLAPGAIFLSVRLLDQFRTHAWPYYLVPAEAAAVRYLAESPQPGGVLASEFISAATVATAGRQVWVGHFAWTPNYFDRAVRAERLFRGRLSGERARQLVAQAGTRYVLTDCRHPPTDLVRQLGATVQAVHPFGCASVIETGGPPSAPATASAPVRRP